MDIIVTGISFKTATVEERELYVIESDAVSAMLGHVMSHEGVYEAFVLSTCNRTEIYTVCTKGIDPSHIRERIFEFFRSRHKDLFYTYRGSDAVKHIFRVCSGLESQMIGENQIKSQVKEAYTLSCRFQASGSHLNRLMHKAFGVAKRVKTETNLGEGAVSISSAAVELALHIFEKLDDKKVLLIGAGETGEMVLKSILSKGVGDLTVTNRTYDRAREIASKYGAEAKEFKDLGQLVMSHDLVISATSSDAFILTPAEFTGVKLKKRVMMIDIAVPRDIDPALSKLDNIFLYDMDDLKVVVEKNLKERMAEISMAEKIVADATDGYIKWMNEQKVVPTIKMLQKKFEDVRSTELKKHKTCATCSKRSEIDQVTKNIINKLLMAPINRLTKDTGCTEAELKYLREMFGGFDET